MHEEPRSHRCPTSSDGAPAGKTGRQRVMSLVLVDKIQVEADTRRPDGYRIYPCVRHPLLSPIVELFIRLVFFFYFLLSDLLRKAY